MYETILKHVVESNDKSFMLDASKLGIQMKTAYYGLKARIKGSTYEELLALHIREGKLFITKK
jgi:hypothetical protein